MCLSQAEHPLQALVFIPKADKGACADNYRPLDMPNTSDRIIDSAVYAILAEAFKESLLTDFAKAFERVNPWWIFECLAARSAPAWVKAYVIHLIFGRRTQHKVQGCLLSPITIHQGLAMGKAMSVVLFCLALDPLVGALHNVSSFQANSVYG